MAQKLLVLDDEENILYTIEKVLSKEPYRIYKTTRLKEAERLLLEEDIDVVLTDVYLEEELDGLNFLERIKEKDSEKIVIIMTAFGSVDLAVEAVKKGAFDYLEKPFDNRKLKLVLEKAFRQVKLLRRDKYLLEDKEKEFSFTNFLGISRPMKEVFDLIKKVSDKDVTVLITGESGTGKELVANSIHYNSHRKTGPYVKLNCAAIPSNLLESELFGYEKGAFTGASRSMKGKFELADGGTIFLDEIGDMPLELQSKVLRVLQEGEIVRLGSEKVTKIDVRVIAATNQNLAQLIEEGKFREDLYFRLNVVNIKLPPLRERDEDIPYLAEHFFNIAVKKYGKKINRLGEKVIEKLKSYSWPGNVRELENFIYRLVILSDNGEEIEDCYLDNSFKGKKDSSFIQQILDLPYKEAKEKLLDKFEREYFTHHLKLSNGNLSKMARQCGMYRANLYQKLEKYDLRPEK